MRKIFFAIISLLLSLPAAADTMTNPVIWADVPDPDVIRVGDDYYMVTTTMHLMPGAPVMHSRDLVNWRTIGYVFDRIDDGDRYNLIDNQTVYGLSLIHISEPTRRS